MSWHIIAGAALLAAWIVIIFRSRFDLAVRTEDNPLRAPDIWPSVVAVVPARDEAGVIAETVASLIGQDYPGPLRIILVDDQSSDGTADIAHAAVRGSPRLEIVRAGERPSGWTGKLWAVSQGIARAGEPCWLWLTDADIAHSADSLRTLVACAMRDGLVLSSRMALLRTDSFAERRIVPAFVYFFAMLYPFWRVNDPRSRIAAAAGGCMLIDRAALVRAGGIAAIRGALIDDCAMGALMKRQGPIRLALSRETHSLRAYGWGELWAMIARSAYAQLRYSPLLLIGAVTGIVVLFIGPWALTAPRPYGALFVGALTAMSLSYADMLRFYRQSPLWSLALPLIALFYAAATFASAVQHWRGKGGMWKGRAQAITA